MIFADSLEDVEFTAQLDILRPHAEYLAAQNVVLLTDTSPDANGPLRQALTEQVQHAQWYIGTLAFDMIARDMAPVRFATVATALYHGSQDHAADEALQIAFLQAARLPCTA